MKSSLLLLCGLLCLVMASFAARASTSIATARAAGPNVFADIGPVVVSETNDLTGAGYAFCVQDSSGGATLYWPTALVQTARQAIASNSLRPGSIVTVQGSNSWYSGLYEISYISAVISNSVGPAPTPIDIDITDVQNGAPTGEICESMLVRISGVTFANAGNPFAAAVNQTISKSNMTAIVRVQDAGDPLVGTIIPSGACNIQAILSQFTSSGQTATNGYQLLPLLITAETPQSDPSAMLNTNFSFGVVYLEQTRTLQFAIRNGGSYTNLVITGFTPVSGDTGKFTVLDATFPMTLAPQSNSVLTIRYSGSSTPGALHNGVFSLDSNVAATPQLPVTLRGAVSATPLDPVWINEVDYDNSATPDDEEFVELCGPAGTDITGWQIKFYNGNPSQLSNYFTFVVGSALGTVILPNHTNGYGFYVLRNQDSIITPYTEQGLFTIENGAPDAVRLVSSNGVQAHFLEYEAQSASTYPTVPPPSWADDLTALEDPPGSDNKSLSLAPGFARTNLAWHIANNTPMAMNTTNNTYVPKLGVTINEIMYNPPEAGVDVTEYIEVYNSGSTPVDLLDYYFSAGIAYTQTTSYVLGPGAYGVFAVFAANLQAYNPTTTNIIGEFTTNNFNGLSNSGETITLRNSVGQIADSVLYGVAAPWPTGPNGGGPSLELTDPLLDNNQAVSWAASVNGPPGGTPGYVNSTFVPEPVMMGVALLGLALWRRRAALLNR